MTTLPDEPQPIIRHPLIRKLSEWRCPTCGKLLLRLSCPENVQLIIETRCQKCGAVVTMEKVA